MPPPNRPLQESDLDRSVEIIRDRVDRLGVAEPEIRKQGNDQIVIDLPGLTNQEQVIEIIGKTAQLELFDLEANLVPPSIGAQSFPVARTRSTRCWPASSARQGRQPDDVVPVRRQEEARAGPVAPEGEAARDGRGEEAGAAGHLPKGWRIFGVPGETVVLDCGVGESSVRASRRSTRPGFFYLFRSPSRATGGRPRSRR